MSGDHISAIRAENAELQAALEEARRQRDEAQREEASLGARNAELQAALKLIARQTEPRLDMPKVALAICSAVNKIALAAAP